MLRKIVKAVNLAVFYIYNRIAALFLKVNKKKAVFLSESHEVLDGNLKYVFDAMPAGYEKKVHIKADRRKMNSLSETFSTWYDITTSGCIFLDDFYGLISSQRVREGQNLVQLWHGGGAYKKFGYSRINTGDKIERVHSGYRKYTMAITSSEDTRDCFAEAFGIDRSKTAATGIPRTDVFFDDDAKQEIRRKFFVRYPELKGKKLILVAPTYRGRKVEDADYNFDYADLDGLSEQLGEEYKILTRWHPALRNNIDMGKVKPEKCSMAADFSHYDDVNDLLIVCDTLITDYSSIIFDYSLLNKPLIYFAYDKDTYGTERGLYFSFDEYIIGKVVTDRKALGNAVIEKDMCTSKREEFNRKFMSACDGSSTDRVIRYALGGK